MQHTDNDNSLTRFIMRSKCKTTTGNHVSSNRIYIKLTIEINSKQTLMSHQFYCKDNKHHNEVKAENNCKMIKEGI